MADDRIVTYRELPLNGRLRTNDDPAELVSEGNVVDLSLLQNMRYFDSHLQGIGGTTKINTTVLGNPQIKNMFQFRKDSPAESNVLVAARDSNGLNQKVYRNGTAIPSAGDFTATALFTDSTGYGTPMFSTAPGEKAIYCNGKDTAIWGGSEMKPIGFIDMDPNGTYKYDYTEQVKNSLTDSNNIATLHRRADTVDAATMALWHFDNSPNDATAAAHNLTEVSAAYSTSVKKFGTHSVGGSGGYFTIADHADFDFSGGTYSIDFWINPTAKTGTIYHQGSATDYYKIYFNGSGVLVMDIYAASSLVLSHGIDVLSPLQLGVWSHVALVESGNNYYSFINGALLNTYSGVERAANYASAIAIKAMNDGSTIFNGYLDEFRVSNSARWTDSFDPPTLAYGSTTITSIYVGSQLPVQGVNPYVVTANTTAGAVTGNYWSSSGWASLGAVSGVGATPLSAVGKNTWTFTSTASIVRQKAIDDKVAYWYRFDITDCDATTTISQLTLDTPVQALKELWDGQYRTVNSFLVYKNSTFNDYAVNVFEDSWTSTDTNTFVELDSLATATDALYIGFSERQMGLRLNLIGGHVNTTASTIATVSYYNGTGLATNSDSWTWVGTTDDGTANAGIAVSKSGTVTWTPPALSAEFKVSISGSMTGDRVIDVLLNPSNAPAQSQRMYFYKVVFSQNLSADVQLFFIGGITAPEDVAGHKFAVHHVDRVWYWGSEKDPHLGFCTSRETAQVLRGADTVSFYLKNTPVAGISLFERYGSTAANVQLVCEPTRTWAIVGETVENFVPNCIDSSNGCTSALTMDVATVEILPGTFRRVGMWQSQGGIVICDGSSVTEVSHDIKDKFDPKHANYIGASTLAACSGWIDPVYNEYNWVIPGTTIWAYDILRKKWYEKPLATSKRPSCGLAVYDTNGIAYSYAATASGFMYRMEYGTTIDGTAIPFAVQIADVAPTGSISDRTEACSVRLVGKAKTTTTQAVLIEHFGDSSTTASVPAIPGVSMANSGKRLFSVIRSMGTAPKNHIYHAYKLSVSTSDETIGFEPVFLVLGYRSIGKDSR